MDHHLLLILSVVVFGSLSIGTLVYLLVSHRKYALLPLLEGGKVGFGSVQEVRKRLADDVDGAEFERLKRATAKKDHGQSSSISLEERYFHAGFFTDKSKARFKAARMYAPLVCGIFVTLIGIQFQASWFLGFAAFGALVGLQLPFSVLDRIIARRNEEIMYYLPLVVEQIVIGVSSSLDIGPCLQRVVSMADERDSHNVVTELLRHAQHYVKSGVSIEEALNEIGRLSGHTELKHVFMSLAQVSKHGGEITKQLQELADAVSSQRETRIEAKIKKLELEATGPVGLVFLGFIGILLVGIGMQAMEVFK